MASERPSKTPPRGWKMVAITPAEGASLPLQDWLLVAIPNKEAALLAAKARFPNAKVRVDSEADAAYLAKYDVSDGQIFALVEGS